MKKIRTLKASEIEVRLQSVQNGVANMLLYIDSRAATNLLDETYGMENWVLEYKDVAGQIYGRLSIYDTETNRWVYREDTGSESNIEAQKGLSSDILKRLIVRFGVCELYSSPRITWTDDGYKNTGYKVSEIDYNADRDITHLVIVNRFGKEAFRWDENNQGKEQPSAPKPVAQPTQSNADILATYCRSLVDNGEDKGEVKKYYNFYNSKMPEWKGIFNPNVMWERWQATKR